MNLFVTYLRFMTLTCSCSSACIQACHVVTTNFCVRTLRKLDQPGSPQVITYMMGLLGPEWTEVVNSAGWLDVSHLLRL